MTYHFGIYYWQVQHQICFEFLFLPNNEKIGLSKVQEPKGAPEFLQFAWNRSLLKLNSKNFLCYTIFWSEVPLRPSKWTCQWRPQIKNLRTAIINKMNFLKLNNLLIRGTTEALGQGPGLPQGASDQKVWVQHFCTE